MIEMETQMQLTKLPIQNRSKCQQIEANDESNCLAAGANCLAPNTPENELEVVGVKAPEFECRVEESHPSLEIKLKNSNRRNMIASLLSIFSLTAVHGQSREEIRDARNALIGTIMQKSSGVLEARNSSSRLVGTYDPRNRQTRDHQGRLVSYGNTLSALLMCSGQFGSAR